MEVLGDVKGKISDELYEDVKDLLDIYSHIQFDYLTIKQSSWESLFVKTIEKILSKNIKTTEFSGELCSIVNLTIKNHISICLKKGDVIICNNLLKKLRRKFPTRLVLRHFVYEFEHFGISFMDEVYDLLKEQSPSFRNLLNDLGILDISKEDFINYLNKQYQLGIKNDSSNQIKKSMKANNTMSTKEKKSLVVGKSTVREQKFPVETTSPLIELSVKKVGENENPSEEEQPIPLDCAIVNARKKSSEEIEELAIVGGEAFSEKNASSTLGVNRVLDEEMAPVPEVQSSLEKSKITIDENLIERYSHLTFSEIRDLYGNSFHTLDNQHVQLLERYFSESPSVYLVSPYDAEKEINLLLYDYKRKSIEIDSSILKLVYLKNKDQFKLEESLYLECFVFHTKCETEFSEKFPKGTTIVRSQLMNKLEMLYYGIEDIFDASLTKEQYESVLEKYPSEIEESIKNMLDDYYGIHGEVLSIQSIGIKYGMSYEEAKELLKKSRKLCLSLYSNLNNSQKVDASIYMPYVLDSRYSLNEDVREVLELYFSGASYEEIDKKRGKKGSSSLVSVGLQKIDAYRFGIEKLKTPVENLDIEVQEDIICEINRHPSESVITEEEKAFLSYYLGIRSKYNPEQEKLSGQKLQERLNFKRNVPARYRDIINKIKQRKLGNLEPEFIIIPREKMSIILNDIHLPITEEDRKIICSLLEIKEYPLKNLSQLAQELGVSIASVRRKYQIAIINISKYLIGEKEGTINYDVDIVPNLKYFTSKERILIEEYYVNHLTNKEISKKYGLPIGKTTRLMYRIKTSLNEFIRNPEGLKFDYEYYKSVVDSPNFPFRGDLGQAKKIFALYVGEDTFGRMDIEEIKKTLELNMQAITISRIIDSLVLGTFKYRDGIRKENSFTVRDVRDYYQANKNLSIKELQLIVSFLAKDFGTDMRMDEDLTYLLLRAKNPNYFRIAASKEQSLEVLKKYYNQMTKKARRIFMAYTGITERDLMSEEEKQQVYVFISMLDVMLHPQSVKAL